MRILLRVIFIFQILLSSALCEGIPKSVDLQRISQRVQQMDDWREGRFQLFTKDGRWLYQEKVNWLSGFLGGELWNMYHLTGDETLKQRALQFARQLMPFANKDDTHDMGFIFLPTVVQAYKITGSPEFKQSALKAAEMLYKRFNKKGHFIRAWGKLGSKNKAGWTIIDTMMNLELLFWASEVSGQWKYAEAAYAHAITCMQQHVRADGSTFHVVVFDPESGRVQRKQTHQGASDYSTWARGQAWGVFGFAKTYKYTGDERFLATSERLADFMIEHLPEDLIPFWDLTAPSARDFKDASAAAIFAAGLYELADLIDSGEKMEEYLQLADRIVDTLLNDYLYWTSKRPVEEGLLLHQVYNYHKKWAVDETYPAGDYYFTLALLRYWKRRNLIKSEPLRQRILLDKNWQYLEKDVSKKNLAGMRGQWQRVDLPHTWNRYDVVDMEPGYRRAGSWYKKTFYLNDLPKGKRVLLYFEAANMECTVYVNNKKVGSHLGGYLGFRFDITPYLLPRKGNEILVYVSNAFNRDLIPSQKSDFFIYGGLTRDVWLEVVPQTYLDRLLISTPRVSEEVAQTKLKLNIVSAHKQTVRVKIDLNDAQGSKKLEKIKKATLAQGRSEMTIQLPALKRPKLWAPDHPYLYTLKVQIESKSGVIDSYSEKFGYRWFEFKENGPFFLNGQRLLLRGTHRHEDHAGYGAAMPNAQHRKDMEAIKKMGANFVRLAHYPQDPQVYRSCDSLGLLVWDELPWCRGGMGQQSWQQNTKHLLKEQILQNYNHPSIIIWSLGNELNWLPDFPDGDNPDSLKKMLRELNDLAHALDPGRVTAVRKYQGAVGIVDVFSPSIWAGWYSGVYKDYQKALESSRKKYKRFFHAEFGGASHVGRHTEQVISGEGLVEQGWEEAPIQTKVKNIARSSDWSENYIVDLFDWHLHVMEKLDWFSGAAQWAFKDFATPLRPENPIPYMNQKGLLDRAGQPKDAYYVFKSYWNKQDPFCYIESHTWTDRYGAKGKAREVCVYSNCDQVELLLNGRSLGKKSRDIAQFPAMGFNWQVPFQQGENVLIAHGFGNGRGVCSDTLTIKYQFNPPGKAEKLLLKVKKMGLSRYLLTVTAVDEQGRRSLDYNKRVYFSALQGAKLQRYLGTPTGSDVIEMANGQAQIEFFRYPDQRTVIEVRNQDFKGDYLILEPWEEM